MKKFGKNMVQTLMCRLPKGTFSFFFELEILKDVVYRQTCHFYASFSDWSTSKNSNNYFTQLLNTNL